MERRQRFLDWGIWGFDIWVYGVLELVKPLTKGYIQLTFQYCEFRAEYYRCFEGSRGWKGSGRERVYHTLNGATYYQGRCLKLCKVRI